ncbi:MAG: AMP-binding protein [Thermodesulfovibrionales bacterium]
MDKYVIHRRFFETADNNKGKVVFNYFDRTWKEITYNELSRNSNAIASYLLKKGFKKGEKIAIISENRPEWCTAYLAISLSGAIAVPIDMQLGYEEIRRLIHDSESKAVFFSSKTAENLSKALKEPSNGLLNINQINFDSDEFKKIESEHEITSFPDVSEDDVVSIIYTSGTTGIPKGVELTHKNFCSDADAIIQAEIVTQNDNILSVLPLHHTYPFMCTFLVPVFIGASITYPESLKGPEIMNAIQKTGVSVFVGVPRILELIRSGMTNKMKQLPIPLPYLLTYILRICGALREKTGINLGKVIFRSAHKAFGKNFRFFTSGGAKLDPEIMKDLESLGFTVLEGYGLTETSPVVTFNPIKKRKTGSAGKPLHSVKIKIVDPKNGNELDVMNEGEVVIQGPMVMKGYYKNPVLTQEVIHEGWLFSGDLGYLDRDGYLFITGRLKDVIVLSSGENVYPEDVERQYMKIPLIKEICVIGVEEKGIVESLHAVIVPDVEYAKREKIGNIKEFLRWEINNISLRMPQYLRIKGFTIHPEPLPKTPLGKFRRFMIKEIIKSKSEELIAKSWDEELIKDETGRKVLGCIKPLLKGETLIRSTDNLEFDLGLDSLAKVELVASLERAFSIKLPESFTSEVQTVDDIVKRLKEYEYIKEKEIERSAKWKDILKEDINLEDRKKIGLYHNFLERFLIILGIMILKIIFKTIFRLRVKGLQNLPSNGPYIITPNHTSYIDGFAIAAALPLRLFWNLYSIGWQTYFTGGLLSLFARLAHVIPIDRETYLQKALKMAGYVIRKGKSLLVFPEGGRSYNGELMEFKKGVGILSIELNIPVIPTYIEGSFDVLPKGKILPKIHRVKVIFGRPLYHFDIDFSKKPDDIDNYQFFVNELREKVKMLQDTLKK